MSHFFISSSGATAVEFAIVALPLFLFIFGTIEVGRLFWVSTVVGELAQMGARCIGLPEPSCSSDGVPNILQTTGFIQNSAATRAVLISAENVDVILNDSQCVGVGQFARVTVSKELITAIGTFNFSQSACHVLQPASS